MKAAKGKRFEILKELLQCSDVTIQNKKGETVLLYSIPDTYGIGETREDFAMIKMVSSRRNINIVDRKGETALMKAIRLY